MGLNSAFKGLNAHLNPICHPVALLGAHHIFHVSELRVKHVLCWVPLMGARGLQKSSMKQRICVKYFLPLCNLQQNLITLKKEKKKLKLLSSCLYRASVTIKILYYPTYVQIYNS